MTAAEKVVQKVLDVIGKSCEIICSFLALFMVLLVTVQVILRMFNMPLFGIEELLTFPTIWIYFLGGVCASYTNGHIECGIVEALSKNKRAILVTQLISNIITTVISIYVLKWGMEYSLYSMNLGKKSAVIGIPMPIGECIILVGLTLMAVYVVTKTISSIIHLKANWAEGGEK